MRRTVHGVLLVHSHNHPHLLVLKAENPTRYMLCGLPLLVLCKCATLHHCTCSTPFLFYSILASTVQVALFQAVDGLPFMELTGGGDGDGDGGGVSRDHQ